MQKVDYKKIIIELENKLTFEPVANDYERLIQAYRNTNQLVDAERVAKLALEVFPNDCRIISEWAWNALVKKNYLQESIRLERILGILNFKTPEKIYSRLLNSYFHMNNKDKFICLLEKALNIYPLSKNLLDLNSRIDDFVSDDCEVLVLTTFPKYASKNVGDQLITYSFLELLKRRAPELKYHVLFRGMNLDQYIGSKVKYILAPGFSVSNNFYPNIYSLYTNLNNLPTFVPVGCSFQHISPSIEAFEQNLYSDYDIEVFDRISKKMLFPFFLCRDELIKNMLIRNQINAVYGGDLAIYDEKYLNKTFIPPKKIESLVFTIGHHEKYEYQSYCMLVLLRKIFSEAKLYVSYHSKRTLKSEKIGLFANSLGFKELDVYGDVCNLDVYDNIDVHVGYRLHGHIAFLRRRKPTVLLVEDARSYGFSMTKGTNTGSFEALVGGEINNLAPQMVIEFLEEEISSQFKSYQKVFDFIDSTYNNVISPYMDNLVSEMKKTVQLETTLV